MRRERSAGAVVFNPKIKKYLLLHYPTGHWDFPKGHVEKGEKDVEAAKREIFEETGLEIEILFGFNEIIKYHFKEHGMLIEKKVVYFLGITEKEEVRLSYEHDGYAWLSYEDALNRITYDLSKKVLMKAHLFLQNLGYSS
ncbi:bis(5'-nucleosyl)-tetraphosphatase [Candidatus Aciduliprofundum boonei]|uniref:Bis(5'-nucleosyl)-tetraphosphatase [asymmetrical] n=1 Tax=Aciduliprofundum boonei (strain DSM 19572 / T469) TaxID=439481 RepID=B5IGY7_ACIB4|nr:bis(5'-nucleosyl)-tetraphosphatase [Candidatus Aciduliprofundum boonei]ADD08714.1 NUDIX hydrolase [Aciduliprofundum boonei T469]EDY34490.1 hydrolase, NUDIX family, putative [Aciduliprofundum boonei T469]HII54897.1 NUDIX domain-containing protein [Candidatus Aciduliprofundum boonei]